MENPCYYRHKVTASFDKVKNKIVAGQYEPNTRKVMVVKDDQCEHKLAQKIIKDTVSIANKYNMTVFPQNGLLRHIQIRVGYHTQEVMVTLVVRDYPFKGSAQFARAMVKQNKEITTVVYNVNKRDTPIVLGDQFFTAFGPGFIFDELDGLRFKLSPSTFYQVNPVMTEKLYQKAIGLAQLKGTDKVLDTYCGIGTITLCLAKHVKEAVGVELNPQSVRNAHDNARVNQISNATFIQADSTDFMLQQTNSDFNILFMDPPRSGSTPEFLEAAIQCNFEKIIYISCNPITLKRDLEILKPHYKLDQVVGVDMFPMTEHVESVVLMTRE